MISIPIVFIGSKIVANPQVKELDHVINILRTSDQSEKLYTWIIENDQNMMLLEMIRVHGLITNNNDLSELYNLWLELGYSHKDDGVLIGFNENDQAFNPKVSMMLNMEIHGIVAFCPLEVWDQVRKQFQQEREE